MCEGTSELSDERVKDVERGKDGGMNDLQG